MRVAVIGAGVVGASIAYRLQAGGAQVTLIDAAGPAEETTARSSAWLNGNDKPPLHYQQLNADGIEAHRRLGRDLGTAQWLHESGCVMFEAEQAMPVHGVGPDRLADRVARLAASGYHAELIDRAQARELEPTVDFSRAATLAWFARECWADGPLLVRTLVEAGEARGMVTRFHTVVYSLQSETSGATMILLPVEPSRGAWPRARAGESAVDAMGDERFHGEGELWAFDRVVVAAGRFTDRVAARAGVRVPLAPTYGLLAATTPFADRPRRVVYCPNVHFRPEPGGGLLLQDDSLDLTVGAATPESPPPPGCEELLARARAYVPALADASIASAHIGTRPMPTDGYPIVGNAGCPKWLTIAVTHSGMTLGPLLGELVSREVLSGAPEERLAPYRLTRFAAAGVGRGSQRDG